MPAKEIKRRFSEEIIQKIEETEWWNWPVEKIGKNFNILEELVKE